MGELIIFVDQVLGVNMEFFNPDDSEIQPIENDTKFCLIKSDHQVNCQPMLQQMLITGAFSDVTLVCDDQKQLKAHKSVLSSCSPMLKEILEINGNDSSFIFVRSIEFNVLKSVMQYIYLGKAVFPRESVVEFLNVAKILVIRDLLTKVKFEEGIDANKEQKIEDNESREAIEALNEIDPTDKRFYTNSLNSKPSKLRKRKVIASCKECNMYFSDVNHFEAHNKAVHVDAAEYCCIIDTDKGKSFACKLCSYTSATFSRLTLWILGIFFIINFSNSNKIAKLSTTQFLLQLPGLGAFWIHTFGHNKVPIIFDQVLHCNVIRFVFLFDQCDLVLSKLERQCSFHQLLHFG